MLNPLTRSQPVWRRLCATVFVVPTYAWIGNSSAAEGQDWSVIGRQGIVNLVLVPKEQAFDLKAYERQIDRLCKPEQTCFLNFYTNSKGIAPVVPLPDEIASEATATFRRSAKQGAQIFMWSCRMKVSAKECF
jgi:hypothetical protein